MIITIASNNVKKIQKLTSIFKSEEISLAPQTHLQITSVEETGLTFVENAILKARHACKHANTPSIGEDSGLEVDAIDKQPGIYSARFAGPSATDNDNIIKLLQALDNIPKTKRIARFQSVLVFLRSATDPTPIICEGTWEGIITIEPIGEKGFGYDPIFWVSEYNCTAAQLSSEIKNKISHRAQAMQKLITAIHKFHNL